ncbi:hypothetical protein KCU62_g30, partial [Aureobasidium sp. EXF-3399]
MTIVSSHASGKRPEQGLLDHGAIRKYEPRMFQEYRHSTPENVLWASEVCKKMAGTVPAVMSPAHDAAMYLYEGNFNKPFASEFLTFAYRTSLASSLASPLAPSPAPSVA